MVGRGGIAKNNFNLFACDTIYEVPNSRLYFCVKFVHSWLLCFGSDQIYKT